MQCLGLANRARASLALVLLHACPGAGRLARQHVVMDSTAQEISPKEFPASKVVALLTDMLNELKSDQTADEESYKKMGCLCTSGKKTLAADIKKADETIENSTNVIQGSTALINKLSKDIQGHRDDLKEDEDALAEATTMRESENTKFVEERRQLTETITAVKAARVVLSEHTQEGVQDAASAGSFLQSRPQALSKVSALIREQVKKHASLFQAALSPEQQRKVSLISNAQLPTYKNYASQSGEISGVLEQLQSTFEADRAQILEQEAAAVTAYNQLKAVKLEQIQTSETAIKDKELALASLYQTRSEASVTLEETKAELAAAQTSLADLEKNCKMTDDEWEERKQTRSDEMAAVSEAISILNNDAAFESFTNTFNPSFMQETATVSTTRRVAASRILAAAAMKTHNPLLSTLAVQAKLDSFTRVKAAIDDMIVDIRKQKEDDIKQRDWCIAENNSNEADTQTKTYDLNALVEKQTALNASIASKKTTIEELTTRNSELQEDLKKAGDVREAQHSEFQTALKVQMETQSVLKAAKEALEKFYLRKPPLAEKPSSSSGVFETYEKKGSSKVLALLDEILKDTSKLEAETRQAELDAQSAYEMETQDTNDMLAANLAQLSTTKRQLSGEMTMLSGNQDSVDSVTKALNLLSNEMTDLNASCDFVINNFEVRQTGFDAEVGALREANAFLSGAKIQD